MRQLLANQPEELIRLQNNLLESICIMHQDFFKRGIYYGWCENTLNNLLDLTRSKIGFICELLYKEDGTPYIKSHGISNIAWDEPTRSYYEEHHTAGLEFFNFKSLWGEVFKSGCALIANDPDNDPRRGGYPKAEGHPPLKTFLALPIKDSGNKVVGVIGVANRPDGYNQQLIDFLAPFLTSYGLLIEKSRLEKEREDLIEELNKSLAEIKTLKGIVPICMHCKGIRDDQGYWNTLETYITEHTDAVLSHGICEKCLKKHYPQYVNKITERAQEKE